MKQNSCYKKESNNKSDLSIEISEGLNRNDDLIVIKFSQNLNHPYNLNFTKLFQVSIESDSIKPDDYTYEVVKNAIDPSRMDLKMSDFTPVIEPR